MRVFAKIGVNAGIEVFVLSLDRRLKRIGGDAQALGEFFDGVGDDNVSVVDQTLVEAFDGIERHVGGSAVVKWEDACASVDVELLEILFVVRVPDIDNGMVRLCQRGVEDVIVRCGFVGEALAVEIDLRPRIRTHPEQGADRVRPAELIGFYSNAVEDHRGVDFVHVRARPQARLDAVARGAVDGDGEGVLVHGLRLQGFEHIFIACIAARADHCALACV